MRGLYAIVDLGVLSLRHPHEVADPIAFARAVLVARPAALQLRAKGRGARETLALLRELLPMCRAARVPLVANDRPDLALLAGCDMVHIGQDDIPPELARRIAPGLAMGISAHTPEQLRRALTSRPAYVAYGPVFETTSKAKPDPVVGLAGLREAARIAEDAGVPLVAIGGIDLAHAHDVAAIAPCAAVIGALAAGRLDYADVVHRAMTLSSALGGGAMVAEARP